VVEGETGGARDGIPFDYAALRSRFDGALMVNNGYDRQMAVDAVASGRADLVSFGRLFIANPDLVERLKENAPLNKLNGSGNILWGGAHGYYRLPFPQTKPRRDSPRRKDPGLRCNAPGAAGLWVP